MKRSYLILIAFFGIILLGTFFRFYLLSETPPGLYPDEAMNGNNALEAIATNNWKTFYPENNGREGLFINLQAISIMYFGAEPWALRLVSAIFGVLAIIGTYLLAKELFLGSSLIPLISAFFLATSYWHINFSRIGFRAIMVPFVTSFALYFLLKGLRTQKISSIVFAGIFTGIGFHTYIAFRFFPFVLLVPIIWYLWNWYKEKSAGCSPCAVGLFILVCLITVSPLIFYFTNHPEDFIGRSGQVSVFSAENPILEFIKSDALTTLMFFVSGDCNWRHNYDCQPELHPIVGIAFAIGLFFLLKQIPYRTFYKNKLPYLVLFAWLIFMSFPATLTREGIPHALRAIGMIPPVMIIAGLGFAKFFWFVKRKLQTSSSPRLEKEITLLLVLPLLLIPIHTYRAYFQEWAYHQETYFAFGTDLLHLGQYLNTLPENTTKYVIVNVAGQEVRGIPMPAQTVMFTTDTFRENTRDEKNIRYIKRDEIDSIRLEHKKTIIALLSGGDRALIADLQKKFPELKIRVPKDFVILEYTP